MIEVIQLTDIIVWLVCSFILIRHGRLGHSHPATLYIIFHFVIVTWRLGNIVSGAETYAFTYNGYFIPVNRDEIMKAVILTDIAFIVMTCAWIKAQKDDIRKNGSPEFNPLGRPITLLPTTIWITVIFLFPVGIVGLIINGVFPQSPEADLGIWSTSRWISNIQNWSGLAILILIYWYGFRKKLTLLMAVFLFIMAIQGENRVRFLIPLLLIFQVYLDQKQLRWPPFRFVIVLILGILLFLPLKEIGPLVQTGASLPIIIDASIGVYERAFTGNTGELQDLDYLAGIVSSVDETQNYQFLKPYWALIVSPIPRQLWPDKPSQNSAITSIVSPERQSLADGGAVSTYVGEAYINFGFIGVVLVPYVFAYWITRLYYAAYRANYYSRIRLLWLWIACNLVNYYHAGGMALILSMTVFMMPILILLIVHIVVKFEKSERGLGGNLSVTRGGHNQK